MDTPWAFCGTFAGVSDAKLCGERHGRGRGDICNLGIFCVAPASNRNLLDFITEALDNHGCAHIAYADDNIVNLLRVANQTSGPCL